MSANIEQMQLELKLLRTAVQHLSACLGARLSREQMCDRIGVHRNTLARYMDQDTSFPRPGKDGKWLLTEVIEWEQHRP